MFAFSLATSYKIFNFEILWKKIWYFSQPNISLVEENLNKLEKDSDLPVFTDQEKEIIETSITELKKIHTSIPDYKRVQSNLQYNKKSNIFNARLINNNGKQVISSDSSTNKVMIISYIPKKNTI